MTTLHSHTCQAGPNGERHIAVLVRTPASPSLDPPVIWLGGFRSDRNATKATALDRWADETGRICIRFDYSGHGASLGRFEDGTLSQWLEDTLAVVEGFTTVPFLLVGSSMGGWLALLAARALRERASKLAPCGLVLIAPAVDFTEKLMWEQFSDEVRACIDRDGVWMRPSAYTPEPTPVTHALIEDGRKHLMLGAAISPGCPVHILQGQQDLDVPWPHALALFERLPGSTASLTFIKDGDHRLSRPKDLALMIRAVEEILL